MTFGLLISIYRMIERASIIRKTTQHCDPVVNVKNILIYRLVQRASTIRKIG